MGIQQGAIICSKCYQTNPAGTAYCAHCGEPMDPKLLGELNRMYMVLVELDTEVTAGRGGETVEQLRDSVRARYLAARAPHLPTATPATVTTPLAGKAPTAAAGPTPVAAPAPAQPHGPVFSWRAFIAEQAIAVMAYLGGFLLLIATLTFVLGGWNSLSNSVKLVAVIVVYLIFGVLGTALRRAASLRTVSRVYLGVFALMTPLLALAVYRFELQGQRFPVAGLVCLAALYSVVVYLALAVRTRFVTYAYLGWAASLLAALAIPSWANASATWDVPALAAMGLVLLIPHALLQRTRADATPPAAPTEQSAPDNDEAEPQGWHSWLGVVTPSALQMSLLVTLIATAATLILGAITLTNALALDDQHLSAFAVAACVLVPLAAAWSWTARTLQRPLAEAALQALDWSIAGAFALATSACATALHAQRPEFTYTLVATALIEGIAVESLHRQMSARHGLRVGVQALAAVLVTIAAINTYGEPLPNAPLLVACMAGIALGWLFAMRGSPFETAPWGLVAGGFLLVGAATAFGAVVPAAQLNATTDRYPDALVESPTLLTALTLALAGLALGLRLAPEASALRRLRLPIFVTALVNTIFVALGVASHTQNYAGLLLGIFALVTLLLGRIERQPIVAGIFVFIYGSIAAATFTIGNSNGALVAALPILLALAALGLRWSMGRAYSVPVSAVTIVATLFAFMQLRTDALETTAGFSLFWLGLGGWVALVVAATLAVDALESSTPAWMIAPAAVALLSMADARDAWPLIALTLLLAGAGIALRQVRGPGWDIAVQVAAVLASIVTLGWTSGSSTDPEIRTAVVALLFAAVAYVIALQHRQPYLTAATTPYAVTGWWFLAHLPHLTQTVALTVAMALTLLFIAIGMVARQVRGVWWDAAWHASALVASAIILNWTTAKGVSAAGHTVVIALLFSVLAFAIARQNRQWLLTALTLPYALLALGWIDYLAITRDQALMVTVGLTLAFAAAGIVLRRTLGMGWSLAPYALALAGVLFTVLRTEPRPDRAAVLEATLLVYAAVALFAALMEETPWATIAPAAIAMLAALTQHDTRALLPLAFIFAVAAFAVSRTRGARWSLPLYGATLVAAGASAWQGYQQAGPFEVGAFAALALLAWLLAALESRIETLLLAFIFGTLGASIVARAFTWQDWTTVLAFAALAWILELSRHGWLRFPGLRATMATPLVNFARTDEQRTTLSQPHSGGAALLRIAAVVISVGAVVSGLFAPQPFETYSPQTQVIAVALLLLAGLLVLCGWGANAWRPARYLAGEALALFISCELRWLGLTNPQAWILAPGSMQLLIGALLPADTRVRVSPYVAQAFSLVGALILLGPTLLQSITESLTYSWIYALTLAVEALLLTLLAVGLRNRTLALTGAAFVGVAAIRGAIIAVQRDLPIPLVIGLVALMLMGLATWLSIRARQSTHAPTTTPIP